MIYLSVETVTHCADRCDRFTTVSYCLASCLSDMGFPLLAVDLLLYRLL